MTVFDYVPFPFVSTFVKAYVHRSVSFAFRLLSVNGKESHRKDLLVAMKGIHQDCS